MRTDGEILKLIEEKLENACSELWDELTPEERRLAFRSAKGKMLIQKWLDVTF